MNAVTRMKLVAPSLQRARILSCAALAAMAVAACGQAEEKVAPEEAPTVVDAVTSAEPLPPDLDAGTDAAVAPPAAPQNPEIDAVCAEEAAAYCNALSLKVPDVMPWYYGDLPACHARVAAGCKVVLARPDTGWTVPARRACAQAWPSATVDELLAINAVPAACRTPAGKKPDNAVCLLASECASRNCLVAGGAGCGVCAALIPAGGVCEVSLQCADGLECNYDAVDGASKCGPQFKLPAIGTKCTAHEQCGAFRYCRGTYTYSDSKEAWTIKNGTCQSYGPAAVGGACGDFTGPGTKTTIPLLDAKVCVGSTSYCKFPSDEASQGTCLPRPADGQPCKSSSGCAGHTSVCQADLCVSMATLQCK